MKHIKAIIQPHMVDRVVQALHDMPHFPGLTIFDAVGQGRGRGAGGAFQMTDTNIFYDQKKIMIVICADDAVFDLVEIIRKAAHTGRQGDGIIIVTTIDQVTRIRTGEHQEQAV